MAAVDALGPLILRLRAARDFEAAAKQTLVAMLAVAEDHLARSPAASGGRLLRGVLHLRPNDSYQRLFGVEHPHGEHVEGTGYLTSANVWRWVSEHRTAVSINVKTGTLRTWLVDGASEPEPLRDSGVPGAETRNRMIQREATHVHVVPFGLPPEGNVIGMVSLEVHLRSSPGDDVRGDSNGHLPDAQHGRCVLRRPRFRLRARAGAVEALDRLAYRLRCREADRRQQHGRSRAQNRRVVFAIVGCAQGAGGDTK